MTEMVSWMSQENDIALSPFRSRLSLKMLSGDMLEIDLEYGDVDYTPYQQINIFLRDIGIKVCRQNDYSIFDENSVVNLDTNIIHDGQEMNIFIH